MSLETDLINLSIHENTNNIPASTFNTIINSDINIKRINYLEVFNFKSYHDYHYIGPFLSYTCIIGPNGGGKSNIIDAICFVLGFDFKTMRTSNPKDIIYKKSTGENQPQPSSKILQSNKKKDDRIPSGGSSPKLAWVSISFQYGDQNRNIKLRRNIDLTSKSEYFIEERPIILKDYSNFLAKNKIFILAKSFLIMQGEIDIIAEKSPQELCQYFENLSGSITYKEDYDDLNHKMNDIEKELKEKNQILAQYKAEKRRLREVHENSVQYQKLITEYDNLELEFNLMNFLDVDISIYKLIDELDKQENELDILLNKKNEKSLDIQKVNINKRKLQNELKNEEKTLEAKKIEINTIKSDLVKHIEQRNLNENLIKTKEITRQKFNEELISMKEKEDNIRKQINLLKKEIEDINSQIINQNTKLQTSASSTNIGYEDYIKLNNQFKSKTYAQNKELEKLYNDENILTNKIDKNEENIGAKTQTMNSYEPQLKEIKMIKQAKTDELLRVKAEQNKLNDEFANLNAKKQKKIQDRSEIQKLLENHNRLQMDFEMVNAQQKEDTQKSQLFFDLFRMARGFKGELAGLIRPIQPKYEISLKLALGNSVNYLVVDKAETAMICNNMLKDRGLMKDVLVLENIPEINQRSIQLVRQNLGNNGNLVSDIIDYERNIIGLDKALIHLLQGKVVCDNMSKAEQIKKKGMDDIKQIITLDGNIIKKGMITGYGDLDKIMSRTKFASSGTLNKVEGNGLGQILKIEEELSIIKQKIKDNETKIKELRTDEEDIELFKLSQKLNEIENTIKTIQGEIDTIDGKTTQVEDDRKNIENDIKLLNNELQKLKSSKNSNEEKINAIKKNMTQTENDIFRLFCEKLNISSIKEYRGNNFNEIERLYERREALQDKIQKHEKSINVSNISKIQDILKNVTKAIEEAKNNIININDKIKVLEKSLGQANKNYEDMQKKVYEIQDKIQNFEKILQEDILAIDHQSNLKTEKEKKKKHLIHSINQQLVKKSQIYEEVKIKGIKVPIIKEEDRPILKGSQSQTSQILSYATQYETIMQKYIKFQKSITIDYSYLLKVLKDGNKHEENGEVPASKELSEEKRQKKAVKKSKKTITRKKNQREDMIIEMEDHSDTDDEDIEINEEVRTLFKMEREEIKLHQEKIEIEMAKKNKELDDYASTKFKKVDSNIQNKLKDFDQKIKEIKSDIAKIAIEHEKASKNFEDIKIKRTNAFNNFFDEFSKHIDNVYKTLTSSERSMGIGGKALIYRENTIEPYNGGIYYSPTPPSKRFIYDVDLLSGGEKTIAGVALMVTANIANNFPFMIFDECDAFLDNENCTILYNFLKRLRQERKMQTILITHKALFFENAESLVGATYFPRLNSSQVYSFDLRK